MKTILLLLNAICLLAFIAVGNHSARLQDKLSQQERTIEVLEHRVMSLEQKFSNNRSVIYEMGGLR